MGKLVIYRDTVNSLNSDPDDCDGVATLICALRTARQDARLVLATKRNYPCNRARALRISMPYSLNR